MKSAAMMTNVGCCRTNNEDCAAIDSHIAIENVPKTAALDGANHLLIVADGVGGYDFGEVASRTAVEYLIGQASSMLDVASCEAQLRAAHQHLIKAMRQNPTLAGMGTTVAGLALNGDRAIWFNAGDSRAYLYRDGIGLSQLSTDHTPQTDLTEFGCRSHMLTQWLGGRHEKRDVRPSVGVLDLQPGDRLLICSDGLTDALDDEGIEHFWLRARTPEEVVQALVGTVLQLGAEDNVTVIAAA